MAMAVTRLDTQLLSAQHAAGFTDLRQAHSNVFAFIPPEGIRLSDLAARARMTKQAMSELVLDLEQLGYLERRPDPDDGRSKVIELTKRGWAAINNALDTFDRLEAELAREHGAKRISDLRATLLRLLPLE